MCDGENQMIALNQFLARVRENALIETLAADGFLNFLLRLLYGYSVYTHVENA